MPHVMCNINKSPLAQLFAIMFTVINHKQNQKHNILAVINSIISLIYMLTACFHANIGTSKIITITS